MLSNQTEIKKVKLAALIAAAGVGGGVALATAQQDGEDRWDMDQQAEPEMPSDIYAPIDPHDATHDVRVLIITDNEFNDTEMFYPHYRFVEEGYEVHVASSEGGDVEGQYGTTVRDTRAIDEIDADDYHVLYLPGGDAPGTLREHSGVLETVQAFDNDERIIGAVCHGPQVLVSADLVEGRRMSAVAEVGEEISEAGGYFMHETVVTDGHFVTSRLPKDLPSQMREMIGIIEQNRALGLYDDEEAAEEEAPEPIPGW